MKPEFAKPGMNPFFTALAQSRQAQTEATPVQKLGAELRDLEECSELPEVHERYNHGIPEFEICSLCRAGRSRSNHRSTVRQEAT